ncbi:putative structure-specific endonuclease subunit Slx4 [Septoria linicola]|nr:putative structure-specific endonuclease subunit Slx4 [Septoria linicola]
MAHSPVVINSSSPPPFRLPSETPPQAQPPASNANATESSSSPGLPSPSSFFKKPAAGLQVKNAAPGIKTGFQSASSLLKLNFFHEQAQGDNDHVSDRPDGIRRPAATASSVTKRRKAVKSATGRPAAGAVVVKEHPTAAAKSPLHTYAYNELSVERPVSKSPAPCSPVVPEDAQKQASTKSRTPSVSLSVDSFDGGFESETRPSPLPRHASAGLKTAGEDGAGLLERSVHAAGRVIPGDDFGPGQPQALGSAKESIKPAQKIRKRVAKTAFGNDGQAVKQVKKRAPKPKAGNDQPEKSTRKPIAKSASFVLNSDDLASTQFAGMDAAQVQGSRPPDFETFRHDSIPVEKPKRGSKRTKTSEDRGSVNEAYVPGEHNIGDTASAYFGQPAVLGEDSAVDLGMTVDVQGFTKTGSTSPVHAHQRRRSWTPAKNTSLPIDTSVDVSVGLSDDDGTPALSLAAVLGNMAYDKQSVTVPQRATSGESLLKRRRIELNEELAANSKVEKNMSAKEKAVPAEKVKKPKAIKKKPQTITELATKAYRPEDAPQVAQATVSSFFTAQGAASDKALPGLPADETSAKPKKPRKPREKEAGDEAKSDKPKKPAKPKAKAKVRFNENDLFGELYAPEQARLQENRQDFLFGTSSQLGAEESPTFIRQMQLAVRESEATSTLEPVSTPSQKSCVKVPTAPHGTSLSCGQGARGLWCSAARDDLNEVLAMDHASPPKRLKRQLPHPVTSAAQQEIEMHAVSDKREATSSSKRLDSVAPLPGSRGDKLSSETVHEIVDLCFTSPIVDQESPKDAVQKPLRNDSIAIAYAQPPTRGIRPQSQIVHPASDDWAILEDSSPEVPLNSRRLPHIPSAKSPPRLKRYTTSPVWNRSALQALDANISPHVYSSPSKAFLSARHLSTNTAGVQPKPRSLQNQEGFAISDIVSKSPRPRGRPPKQKPDTTSDLTATCHIASPSKLLTASQPVTSSDFVNIDEISDNEAAVTPLPPRRRAASTPPSIRSLEFEVVASPAVKAKGKLKKPGLKDTATPATAWSKLKPDDATWISIMPTLFPQITATIKSTAPSTDLAKPTWYEKILLYDPIVLEDLTTWLTERGVRVETKRLKAKPKIKARKKKKEAPGLEEIEEIAAPDEYESVQEPLKPWMVQKWCEDKSICCLWKEGLRGGDISQMGSNWRDVTIGDHGSPHIGHNIGTVTNNNYGPETRDNIILDSLWFEGMLDFKVRTRKPPLEAWEWVYEDVTPIDKSAAEEPSCDSHTEHQFIASDLMNGAGHLRRWLRSGDGIFYICGKATSGKSTLLELLATHSKTQRLLEAWAGPSTDVVTVKYFAGTDGASKKRKIYCLLRSLLWQLFMHKPSLIEISVPARLQAISRMRDARNEPWAPEELDGCLYKILTAEDTRFVFFVDGLDDPDAQPKQVIDFLKSIARYPNAKVCASSRTHADYDKAFGSDEHRCWSLNKLSSSCEKPEDVQSLTTEEDTTADLDDLDMVAEPDQDLMKDIEEVEPDNSAIASPTKETIDLTIPHVSDRWYVASFKKWFGRDQVFEKLREGYAGIFERQAKECVPREEITERLGEVAATIRSSDIIHLMRDRIKWSRFLADAQKRVAGEWKLAVGQQKRLRRESSRELLNEYVESTRARAMETQRIVRVHNKMIHELKKWHVEEQTAFDADTDMSGISRSSDAMEE